MRTEREGEKREEMGSEKEGKKKRDGEGRENRDGDWKISKKEKGWCVEGRRKSKGMGSG